MARQRKKFTSGVTSRDVFSKRKAGQIDEAYQIAIELINNPNHDEWDVRAFAWCVIDLIKRDVSNGYTTNLAHYKKQLMALNLPDDDILMKQCAFALDLCNPNSITSKHVFEKRKAGHLDEAYNMAVQLINNPNHDEWDIKAFAWCVIDLIKRDTSNGDATNLIHYKQQLESIDLTNDEILSEQSHYALSLCNPNIGYINQAKALYKKQNYSQAIRIYQQLFFNGDHSESVRYGLGWAMYQDAKQLINQSPTNYHTIKRHLNDFFKLNIDPPKQHTIEDQPELHTCMLRIADQLASKDQIQMARFVKIWNLDNLVSHDFESYIADDGKVYLSLAEKVVQHSLKDALSRESKDDIIYLHPYLDKCMMKHPENIWLKLYKTKVLLLLEEYDNALDIAIKFVKEKSKEFWAWELLGDIIVNNDIDMATSAYCKALTCSKDINFTSKVKLKLAQLLVKQGNYPVAKTEIASVVDFKNSQQHKIPVEIQEIMSEDWFVSTEGLADNNKFYRQNTSKIETFLYHDLPWTNATIGNGYTLNNNKTKRNIYIATSEIPTELSISESQLRHLSHLSEGDGIKVKAEYDNQKIKIHLIEERESQKNDVFHLVDDIAVIDHINHNKKLLHFIVKKEVNGIIKFSHLTDKFSEGDCIRLKLAMYRNKRGMQFKLISAQKTCETAPPSLIKSFNSTVTVSNNMGFTDDDIFIPPPLVREHEIKDGCEVSGKAILNYNNKRNEWGWRALSIDSS